MGINPELLRQARQYTKVAFVPAGDPALGGDPAMAGGAPPMDPAMAGGAPPMEDPLAAIQPMIQEAVAAAMASQGGGMGGASGAAAIKPKIDINVEIMQIKKLLARLCDAMGVQIPAAEMVATPEDLNQIAEGGPGAAAGGGAMGAIAPPAPIDPMKAAAVEDWEAGVAFDPPATMDFSNSHATTKNTANLATAMLMRSRAGA
jgi:hypothetical protein